ALSSSTVPLFRAFGIWVIAVPISESYLQGIPALSRCPQKMQRNRFEAVSKTGMPIDSATCSYRTLALFQFSRLSRWTYEIVSALRKWDSKSFLVQPWTPVASTKPSQSTNLGRTQAPTFTNE